MCRHQRINKCGAQQFHSQTGLILFCMFQLIFNSKKWNCILMKLLKSCMCLYFTQEAWRHVTWLKCGVVQPIINETVPAPECWKCRDALFTPSSSINCWITVFEPKVWISVEYYQYLLLSEAFASEAIEECFVSWLNMTFTSVLRDESRLSVHHSSDTPVRHKLLI